MVPIDIGCSKINVRNSYPVDLLTRGFQFEAIERNVFRYNQTGRLRPSVLSRRGINFDRGESRGYDTDGSTTVKVRDKDEGGFARNARCNAGKEGIEQLLQGEVSLPRCRRNTRATGERQVSSTSFISRRLVSRGRRKILLSLYLAKQRVARHDLIRNLKKWQPPRQVIRDVECFSALYARFFISFCFIGRTTLSDISRAHMYFNYAYMRTRRLSLLSTRGEHGKLPRFLFGILSN